MGWPQAKLGSMNDRGGASFPVSKAKYKALGQVSKIGHTVPGKKNRQFYMSEEQQIATVNLAMSYKSGHYGAMPPSNIIDNCHLPLRIYTKGLSRSRDLPKFSSNQVSS